jgi:hypothetical protein
MRKTVSLHNIAHKYGAGLLIPAYFVLGIALVPIPEMGSVQNVAFSECHKSGKIKACSSNSSVVTTITGKKTKAAVRHGSTGPTVPPTPGHKH